MKRLSGTIPPITGALLLVMMFLIEYYTGISNSVGYVLAVLVILWFFWRHKGVVWTGVVAMVVLAAGFLVVEQVMALPVFLNRVMALLTIWISVIFAYRYRKLFEDEEVQKRQLQALFENATEGMIFTDSRGQVVRVNPAAEQMFGFDSGELQGKPIEALVPDRLVDIHAESRKKLLANPMSRPKGGGRELLAKRKNGDEFIAEVSLSYFYDRQQVFYIAFIVDISERKKQEAIIEANVNSIKRLNEALDAKVKQRTSELEATLNKLENTNSKLTSEIAERKKIEERLIKSKMLYTAIARNFPEGVIGVLDRSMRYVLAEGRELEKIGFSHRNAVGERLFDHQDKELTAGAEAKLSRAFSGETVSFDIDVHSNTYNLIAVPLPDVQNNINEILVVMKNVTERKLVERKLVRTIEKEKELSALKSRFVTMASHEFRTPLSTMLSSVFLLQNYTGEKYEAQKKTHLDRIRRSIQTLTELMNDFLSIGQLEEGHVKTVLGNLQIKPFLDEIVSDLNGIKKSGQVIHLSFTGEDVAVETDRHMLTNILRNLLSNAVKYSANDAPIYLRARLEEDGLDICVQDQGIGIPEHEQAEIFKRFYRAENVTNIQGTGLGLNIVKKYVKLLNGTIDFKSRVNEGTTFTVHLPVGIVAGNEQSQLTS